MKETPLRASISAVFLNFEDVVAKILAENGYQFMARDSFVRFTQRRFGVVDFVFKKEEDNWLVEVKFYRTVQSQFGILRTACAQLVSYLSSSGLNNKKGMLVVSSIIRDEDKRKLQEIFNIQILDRSDLRELASLNLELIEELESLLEDPFAASESISEKNSDSDGLKKQTIPNIRIDTKGAELCKTLKVLRSGRTAWADYEKLCFDILQYLFSEHLNGWHEQKRTDDGLNRYDLVCRIKSSSNSFWNFLANDLNSRYIIFEFKNYVGKIKQGQILTTEKYLLETALRKVAIILTRKGADKNALKAVQGAMREHGKLMIILDDDLLCAMLEDKQTGSDPSDRLFELADSFLLSLPR